MSMVIELYIELPKSEKSMDHQALSLQKNEPVPASSAYRILNDVYKSCKLPCVFIGICELR